MVLNKFNRRKIWETSSSASTGATPMTDRLIGKRDIAAMLGTSPGVAASVLEE